jgi:hypothetical protein
LASGELAINYTDGKLFYKDNNSAVQIIGWKTTPTTAGGTGLTSYTAGDLPYYSSGSALSKLAIGTTNYVLTSSGTAPQYVAQSTLSVGSATNATNTAITDNTSSSATWYPTIVSATTGNLPQTTSSTKFSFVPNTGTLTVTNLTPTNPLGTAYGGTNVSSSGSLGSILVSNGTNWVTNVVPAFNVQLTSAQTIAGASYVKITLNNKIFDTNSNFDATTNYRFTPTVAGYYQINGALFYNTSGASGLMQLFIYKNGSTVASSANPLTAGGYVSLNVSQVVYCNGSTDYIELYTYNANALSQTTSSGTYVYMSGSFVRGG